MRSPVAVSHTIIFESAPPEIRTCKLCQQMDRASEREPTSFPSILAQNIVFTKSEWPLYLLPAALLPLSQLQISLSQHPAKIVAPPCPPIATDVTGAVGPLYTVFVSFVYDRD